VLTIVDDFTKESVDLVAEHGISGQYVVRVLERAAQFRGLPPWQFVLISVKQRATLSRLGVETASNSFHLGV
jgi:hypothetical protein